MTALPRRAMFLLPLLAAGCATGETTPTSFDPFDFSYLTKLRLKVGSIDIDSAWRDQPGSRDVGYLSPVTPDAALRQMAQQRLVAGGGPGRALFTTQQASLVADGGNYVGDFAVRLDVLDDAGDKLGYAEARVSRGIAARGENQAAARAALYRMTRRLMDDMNVEFEYQVRRSLKDFLLAAVPTAPEPGRVETQDLPPP